MYWEAEGWKPTTEAEHDDFLRLAFRQGSHYEIARKLKPVVTRKPLRFWPNRADGQARRSWLVEMAVRPDEVEDHPAWKLLFKDMRLLFLTVEMKHPSNSAYEEECFKVRWSSADTLEQVVRRLREELPDCSKIIADHNREAFVRLSIALTALGAQTDDDGSVGEGSIGVPYVVIDDEEPARAAAVVNRPVVRLQHAVPTAPMQSVRQRLEAIHVPDPASQDVVCWLRYAGNLVHAFDDLPTRTQVDYRSAYDPGDLQLSDMWGLDVGQTGVSISALTSARADLPKPVAATPSVEVTVLWRSAALGSEAGHYRLTFELDDSSGTITEVRREELQCADSPDNLVQWRVIWISSLQCSALVAFAPALKVSGVELANALKVREAEADRLAAGTADAVNTGATNSAAHGELSDAQQLAHEKLWTNVVVEGDFDLSNATWKQPLPHFVEVMFCDNVRLGAATITHGVTFSKCRLLKRLDAPHVTVTGDFKIDECEIDGRSTTAEGYRHRSLPCLDLSSATVNGSVVLLLTTLCGVVNLAGAEIAHKLLVKGVFQLPRLHDAERVRLYHLRTTLFEPIYAMFDLRHATVGQAVDFSPARVSFRLGLLIEPGQPRNGRVEMAAHSDKLWRRTQLAGQLRLDHAKVGRLDLRGLLLLECGYRSTTNGEHVISSGRCDLDYLETKGRVDLGIFVERWHDPEGCGVQTAAAFRFVATELSAKGARCGEMRLDGALVAKDAALIGLESRALIVHATENFRARVGRLLDLSTARLEFVSIRGAMVQEFRMKETAVSGSVVCWPIGVTSHLRVGGPVSELLMQVAVTEFGQPANVSIEPHTALGFENVSIGGDLALCAVRIHGDMRVGGSVKGSVTFWDASLRSRLERKMHRARIDRDDAPQLSARWVDTGTSQPPPWSALYTMVSGKVVLKGLQVGGNVDLSNLNVGAVSPAARPFDASVGSPPGQGGELEASDIVVGGDLWVRAWAGSHETGIGFAAMKTYCGSVDLRMGKIEGDCRITGLEVGTYVKVGPRPGAWPRFFKRILGLPIEPLPSVGAGGFEARGITVRGELELFRQRTAVGDEKSLPEAKDEKLPVYVRVAGVMDLAFASARSLVMCGETFDAPTRDLLLDHATIGRIQIVRPFPSYVNLRGIVVDDWDVEDKRDLLEILDNSLPFDSANYSQMETNLRRAGDERRADEVYRALCEREWDERVGKATHLGRIDQPEPVHRSRRLLMTLGGWSGLWRNVMVPLLFFCTIVWLAHEARLSAVFYELPLLIVMCLVAATIFQRALVDGLYVFRVPEHRPKPGMVALVIVSCVIGAWAFWHPSHRWLVALPIGGALVYVFAWCFESLHPQYTDDLTVRKRGGEIHVWTRMAKWTLRFLMRPIRGTALLLARLLSGYLTNPRPMIAMILMSFVIGMSAFTVPRNFTFGSQPSKPTDPARGSWDVLPSALLTLHYVVPLASLADVEELYGHKDFLALRDGPDKLPANSPSGIGGEEVYAPEALSEGTYFRVMAAVAPPPIPEHQHTRWLSHAKGMLETTTHWVFGAVPEWILERWGCSVAQSGAVNQVRLIGCNNLRPTDLARLLSAVNWVAWPLVLLGFAARLRQRKSIQ